MPAEAALPLADQGGDGRATYARGAGDRRRPDPGMRRHWYDKPPDMNAARHSFARCAGAAHVLATAVVCRLEDGPASGTTLPCRALRCADSATISSTATWRRKPKRSTSTVGAYRLEGRGVQLFRHRRGAFRDPGSASAAAARVPSAHADPHRVKCGRLGWCNMTRRPPPVRVKPVHKCPAVGLKPATSSSILAGSDCSMTRRANRAQSSISSARTACFTRGTAAGIHLKLAAPAQQQRRQPRIGRHLAAHRYRHAQPQRRLGGELHQPQHRGVQRVVELRRPPLSPRSTASVYMVRSLVPMAKKSASSASASADSAAPGVSIMMPSGGSFSGSARRAGATAAPPARRSRAPAFTSATLVTIGSMTRTGPAVGGAQDGSEAALPAAPAAAAAAGCRAGRAPGWHRHVGHDAGAGQRLDVLLAAPVEHADRHGIAAHRLHDRRDRSRSARPRPAGPRGS